jgi:hypothetical protein
MQKWLMRVAQIEHLPVSMRLQVQLSVLHKKKEIRHYKLSIVVHAYNPITQEHRQDSKFKPIMDYIKWIMSFLNQKQLVKLTTV